MSKSEVTLIDRMGDDITVVNSARVSFNRQVPRTIFSDGGLRVEAADRKLLLFLARENHWSPYSHVQLTFRIKTSIMCARQLMKSSVGLTVNESSRRYVQSKPEFYIPDVWRKAAENVKQGSSSDAIQHNGVAMDTYRRATLRMEEVYEELLSMGVCPEQARMVLPQSMMTEWYWTGSLVAFARVITQRLHPTAQKETADVARMLLKELTDIDALKYSVDALINSEVKK